VGFAKLDAELSGTRKGSTLFNRDKEGREGEI